ncbi:MAG: LemA family protein [Flavobacteriales bacterium]|nr:LemA family protein [Flavobacteriales bacterium]
MTGGTYNEIIKYDEAVLKQWADVETMYQRRADLIPNLVATVKGYAAHEKETLMGVVEARSKATSVNIDASNLTPASMRQFQQAQAGLSSALSKLLVVVEKYPDLKANANFMELQSQLEGSENRIAVARRNFNEAVRVYNTFIRSFPEKYIASLNGFQRKEQFAAQEGADVVPQVQF